jgi:hypothetical protein
MTNTNTTAKRANGGNTKMTNYKDFKEIKAAYKREVLNNQKKFKNYILNMDFNELQSRYYFKDLTKKQQQKSEKEVKKAIIEKEQKENNKRIEKFFKKCDDILKAEAAKNITISVSWVNNSTWGKNPHAEVWAGGQYTTGKASGCGYDKLSTAIAAAFNQNESILKLVFVAYEKALRKNKNISIREAVGYGLGYQYPSFEGGVGYSCFSNFFQKLGAKTNTWQEGKTWDSMTIEL